MAIEEQRMSIKPALQCSSLAGWYPANVESSSDPDTSYTVHVNPWAVRSEQHVCECKSYHFRGQCKHQKIAHMAHCGWNEIEGPEKPVVENGATQKVCPRCKGQALWAMWEQDEH